MERITLTGVLLSAVLITGCSDSSSSGSPEPQTTPETPQAPVITETVSGTAAIGAAITDGTVTAICADGSRFTEPVTTDANGNWSGEVANGAMPCALQVTGGNPPVTLHSYAASAGTVNITPLTDLIMASATSLNTQDWFDNFDGTVIDADTATSRLLNSFRDKGFNVPREGNPLTTPFSADGTGWDRLLDDIGEAIENDPALADYDALVTLVKDGNLANLPTPPAPEMFDISGTVSGATGVVLWETLAAGSITQDGGDTNGAVTFSPVDGLAEGSNWSVVIKTPPADQICEVNRGSGTLTADISDVEIVCSDVATTTYSISGNVSGATGSVVWEISKDGVFYDDGSAVNGAVEFTSAMVADSVWAISINSAPSGQTCNISNGSGTLNSNVNNIAITCSDIVVSPGNYSISGTVSGASGNVIWEISKDGSFFNDGGATNGAVTFTGAMASGSAWVVSINSAPAGQTCSVNNGSGTLNSHVTNVAITCEDETVTPPPGAALYDFSGLNLDPETPAEFTPIAPQSAPVDPASNIASLYQQLGDEQRDAVFAPAPDERTTTVTNIATGSYYEVTEATPTQNWLRISNVSFGADTTADTSDDYIMAYTVYPFGYAGVSYSFDHPGPDGEWYTEDDIAGSRNGGAVIVFPQGTVLEFEGASEGAVMIIPCLDPGTDGIAFTGDDLPGCSLGYQVAVIDGQGNRAQIVSYNSRGADGFWFTDDDVVNNYTLVSTDLSIPQTVTAVYNDEGTDGEWFTADDQVQSHIQLLLGDNYQPLYSGNYNLAGSDGIWFTADDTVSGYGYYGYNDNGDLVIVANHSGIGLDGEWFTSDDFASAVVSLKDDNGNVTINANFTGMGQDGKWLSGDETLYGYQYRVYDDENRLIQRADMGNKGADGLWFTSDDLPNTSYNYWKRELDAEGRILQQLYYDPSLAPGDPAFSASQISRYTVYAADFSVSVSLYRADFGPDETPLTTDDLMPWPYIVQTASGYEQYNQPGPDAEWFTADDVLSGYVTQTRDGSRLILDERYDASGTLVFYGEYSELSPTSYRVEEYQLSDGGTFDLIGYREIDEDAYGNPLWTTWFNAEGEISNVDYTERNSEGLVTKRSAAYSAGPDGIWKTEDDFTYYSLSEYNAAGELTLSASEYQGSDGLWGTGDDTYFISAMYLPDHDADTLAINTGFSPVSCAGMFAESGDITVRVRDINGDALTGAIVMLNDTGSTATTDASGIVSFTGLSGAQDIHVFKDGYGYESFYCVSPGLDVTLHSQIEALGELPERSRVAFYNDVSSQFILVMLDDNGKPLHEYDRFSRAINQARYTYADLYFDTPEGSEVTGNLWAFKVNNGVITGAQDLGTQTYTTIAANGNILVSEREQLSINFTATDLVTVAKQGNTTAPVQGYFDSGVTLGGFLGLDFTYDSATYSYSAKLPGVDIDLPDVTLSSAASTETWELWQPGNTLDRYGDPIVHTLSTGIAFRPLISEQTDSSNNPTLNWTPVSDRTEGHSDINTLVLRTAANGVGYQTAWTIHTPAGESSVTLPTLPAGVTGGLLPENEYALILEARAFLGMDYNDALRSVRLHDLDESVATEVVRTTATEFSAPRFTR